MLGLNRIVQLYAVLFCLLTLCLAKDDEYYDNSTNYRPRNVTGLGDFYQWVGSYYNATAEVELRPIFGDVWNETIFGPNYTDNLCPELKNSTQIVKYDAILSILEKGKWNAGINSVIFWLTLIPKSSAGFNVSSLGTDFTYSSQPGGLQFPLYSVHPSPDGYSRPQEGKGPDIFNFTTTQTNSGAYNISALLQRNIPESYSSSLNLTMPVCNTTELSGDYRVGIEEYRSWQAEDWDDFRWPDISVLFDDKTANLTMDAVFSASPYVWPNATTEWSGPQTGSPGAHGFIQIRVSGVIDAYHSDSLSLRDETPVWLRTVGFGNDSSNIGYDSGSIKLSSEFTISIMVVALGIIMIL
ncbi:uncharacterized protein FSUBG_13140 [Fusarium subglutinans]|uniref:Uncharacterized protein n=1 Tax=Gibberella subglutinans TaxID=42677 RepID=A0A8H5L240_GIBSU|nr:uncharacterized protein FSUBG_13140 [Fusarium subglutinans]KAF5583354.1 hypothetical protein FSUBG_13140 [Fusarium subglutinans]